ncbi:NAD(P)-dependent alcohol dehydrogenase [Aspergillus lucknowensis]|uniref:Chaperonin 10-like protein n=1 Tax=Aspergillus lucknowensis TaxID=176173 RepID=A0ABR4LWS9_9EURO
MTTTRALISYGSYKLGGWKLKNVSLRPLREKELLIEVVASGICQTDLHFAGAESGFGVHYPRVMGHEGAGYVRDIGPNTRVAKVGDPVIMSFSSCKSCEPCARGHPAHCTGFNAINFEVVPGNFVFKEASASSTVSGPDIYGQFFGQSSFASSSIVNEDSIVNVSGLVESRDELTLLSPLGCGVQTGSGAIINAANAGPDDRVAVIGLGGVGLSAVMGAKIVGCTQIIGIDRHESRLELAKELGATHVVRVDAESDLGEVTAAVRAITGDLGTNITLDTTGVPGLIAQGVKMTGFKGKILQVGTAPETGKLMIPIHEFMVSGRQFMGVVEGDVVPREYIPKLIRWVREGKLPLEKIVKFYQADEFQAAIQDMQSGQTVKPVILW